VIEVAGAGRVELVPYDDAYAPGFEDMLRRRPCTEKLLAVTGYKPGLELKEIIRVTLTQTKEAP